MPFGLPFGESSNGKDGPNPNALRGGGEFLWAETQQLEDETKKRERYSGRDILCIVVFCPEINGGIVLNYRFSAKMNEHTGLHNLFTLIL